MYDFRILRDQLDTLRKQLGARAVDIAWDRIKELSEERRKLVGQVDDLRHQLKKGSDEVATLKRAKKPADEAIVALRGLGDQIRLIEDQLRSTEEQLAPLALQIPNVPHGSVPKGADAKENVEIRRWGDLPTFSFKPRPHDELGEQLGIFDFERAGKDHRLPIFGVPRIRGSARTSFDQFYAGLSYPTIWIHRSPTSVYGESNDDDRDRPTSEI